MTQSEIQKMVDNIDKPAIFITPDYVIQAVNESYLETYDARVIVGDSKCHQVSNAYDLSCDKYGEECPLIKCKVTSRASSVMHVHNTSEGKTYCDILMRPIKNEDGITTGFLKILDRIYFAAADSQKNRMIGSSAPFKSMLTKINRVAQSDIAVLLQGDTGTGKELVAKALHDSSQRKDAPFVVIECTGLNDHLFESELFGHEKGAFTGATHAKKGLITIANGGTLFFDEIGDVPLNMQVKLLRLLENHTYRSVGGLKQQSADFRLICASHKNLLELVKTGLFRKDLYYRIAGFPIRLPSLVERKEDIPELAKHFLKESAYRHKSFNANALKQLSSYAFPGNIRELKSIVEQSALMADEDIIEDFDLPPHIIPSKENINIQTTSTVVSLDQAEAQYLRQVCERGDYSAADLAKELGISTRTFYRKLQRYGIKHDE